MVLEVVGEILDKAGEKAIETVKKGIVKKAEELRQATLNECDIGKEEISHKFMGMEEYISKIRSQNDIVVAEERNPGKLCSDISKRLATEGMKFTEINWNNLDFNGRMALLNDMLHVFTNEMELPEKVQRNLQLRAADLGDSTLGSTNSFIRLEKGEHLALDGSTPPIICLNTSLINSGMTNAMETLFHESLHVLQQVSVTEQAGRAMNEPLRQMWKKEIIQVCKTNGENLRNQSFEEYISSEMEAYAHAYDDYLIEVYNAHRVG